MNEAAVEAISEVVHNEWMANKKRHGITSRLSEGGEELMRPYPELSEKAKDLDRVSVRAVLSALPLVGYTLQLVGYTLQAIPPTKS